MRSRRLTSITTDPYTQPAVAIPWPATGEGPVRSSIRTEGAGLPESAPAGVRRLLVAGVGYRNLRDMSAGPELVERLRLVHLPDGVDVEDLSFGAVHVLHWLQERSAYDAAVIVASVARGRAPGSVTCAPWRAPVVVAEEVQQAIAEAVTGVIGLDTLLTVLGYFSALPAHVVTVEIEPHDDDWGPEFSPLVQDALETALRTVIEQVRGFVR